MNTFKSIILFIIISRTLNISAQTADTTCLKSKWIALKPIKENKSLFTQKNNLNNFSLLDVIKQQAEERNLSLYDSEHDKGKKDVWYPIVKIEDKTDFQNSTDLVEITIESIMPLANKFGEDSTIMLADGTLEIIYQPSQKYSFSIFELSEIRIKEEMIFNTKKNKYELQPVAMSISILRNGLERELFWIDLNEFFANIENEKSSEWMQVITQKRYKGFQYRQVSCYDSKMRF